MFLCFDLGSSSVKVGVIDSGGTLLRSTRFTLDWQQPDVIARLVQVAFELSSPWRYELRALAMSGCNPALVALDQRDRMLSPPLFPPLATPAPPADQPSQFIPLVRAFAHLHPQLHARTRRYLSPASLLAFYLSGQTELPLPREQLYAPFFWSPAALQQAGLAAELLPPFVPFTQPVGSLRPLLRQQFALPRALPVFVVAVDFFSSLLGCNALQDADLVDRSGTSEGLNLVVGPERSPPSPASKLSYWPHPLEPLWVVSCQYPWVGELFAAYKHQQGQEYYPLVEQLLNLPPMEDLPQWPLAQLASRGHLFEPLHDRQHLQGPGLEPPLRGRLILDYLALLFTSGVDRLCDYLVDSSCEGALPRRLRRIVLSGGQGHNRLWVAYKGWRSGRTVTLPKVVDSELLGNAMVAAAGLGIYPNLRAAVAALSARGG